MVANVLVNVSNNFIISARNSGGFYSLCTSLLLLMFMISKARLHTSRIAMKRTDYAVNRGC